MYKLHVLDNVCDMLCRYIVCLYACADIFKIKNNVGTMYIVLFCLLENL